MNLTGFDPNIVLTSMNSFMSAANDTLNVLCHQFQSQFVNKMAGVWACKNAQNYFSNTVKPQMDKLTGDAERVFTSVVDAMRSAGNNWAAQTGTTFQGPSFSSNRKTLDDSVIKENINGVRGIDLSAAETISNDLGIVMGAAESTLGRAVAAVRDCGFIGGDSAATLLATLTNIKDNINSTLRNCESQLNKAITATTIAYRNAEKSVAQAFAGE